MTLRIRAAFAAIFLAVLTAFLVCPSPASAGAGGVDVTDHRVSRPEARATFIGETRAHVLDRIGPVTENFNTENTRDYLAYQQDQVWRVRYDSDGQPPMTVTSWKWLQCHAADCTVLEHAPKAAGRATYGHITRLFHTDNWTGAQERFPDTGNVFSDIVAMQTRQEADIWLKPVSGHLFDQCPAHAGTILVELSMWEYNTFLPDSHIGNDKTINACNPESRATWVDVNEDQSIYIKGKMFGQTQCGNCSGGNFTYSWFGDPDDPWRHDSSEKK